ncbi:hypothetical protein D3C80_1444770 [compost metagenome]
MVPPLQRLALAQLDNNKKKPEVIGALHDYTNDRNISAAVASHGYRLDCKRSGTGRGFQHWGDSGPLRFIAFDRRQLGRSRSRSKIYFQFQLSGRQWKLFGAKR